MNADPADGGKYWKAPALSIEDDLHAMDKVHRERGNDHAEWFLVGLIIFGLAAEIAIVLNSLAAPSL
jgi:hypothetical protein